LIKEFTNKEKETFYKEKILHLVNNGSLYRLDSCMETTRILMTSQASLGYFNENDIDVLVDIALRELTCKNEPDTRI